MKTIKIKTPLPLSVILKRLIDNGYIVNCKKLPVTGYSITITNYSGNKSFIFYYYIVGEMYIYDYPLYDEKIIDIKVITKIINGVLYINDKKYNDSFNEFCDKLLTIVDGNIIVRKLIDEYKNKIINI
jgi:hypothetical protein